MPKQANPDLELHQVSLRISKEAFLAITAIKKEYGGSITSVTEDIIETFRHIPPRRFRNALAALETMGNDANRQSEAQRGPRAA